MNQQNNQSPNNRTSPSRGKNFRNNRRRYKGNFNKNKPANPNGQLERLVEKYINLLDQHLIARRKFHDLYFRAEDSQLNKLERNFYSTINDLRDFEEKIAPELKESFEKRINGLKPDLTYSANHQINPNDISLPEKENIHDPHLLQSQIKADFSSDAEESIGSIDDYNLYKNN
jgi:hypothetical protein